jgi:hypothetical protein
MSVISMMPFLDRLESARNVLIAGCGGGFDVFSGVPIGVYLAARGGSVVFANLSFANLWQSGAAQVGDTTWLVDARANDLPYFPEKMLVEWLALRKMPAPVYAFSKTGVQPLAEAYSTLVARHAIDLVVLVDGGTDSVIFGDEPCLGTVAEDAVSLVAACQAAEDRTLLTTLGFGVDHFHGVSHYSFLENVARLSRGGGFLGGFSLVRETPEGEAFLDLVDYANRRRPLHPSILCNSIASALRGEFGDFHATSRTSGSELFISPLMTQYWAFDALRVVANMEFADALTRTETFAEANRAIAFEREFLERRPLRPLPL